MYWDFGANAKKLLDFCEWNQGLFQWSSCVFQPTVIIKGGEIPIFSRPMHWNFGFMLKNYILSQIKMNKIGFCWTSYDWIITQKNLTQWFFIQISIIHDNISSQVVVLTREGRVLANGWTQPSTHDNIGSVVLKKCHPKRYHSVAKFHS